MMKLKPEEVWKIQKYVTLMLLVKTTTKLKRCLIVIVLNRFCKNHKNSLKCLIHPKMIKISTSLVKIINLQGKITTLIVIVPQRPIWCVKKKLISCMIRVVLLLIWKDVSLFQWMNKLGGVCPRTNRKMLNKIFKLTMILMNQLMMKLILKVV